MSELNTKKKGHAASFVVFDSSVELSSDDEDGYRSARIRSRASRIGPAVPNGSSS